MGYSLKKLLIFCFIRGILLFAERAISKERYELIDEIFPNPTVKQVIFQIRFPNLFYMENKIGDFQLRIMNVFPESSLVFRRQLLFADLGPQTKIEDVPIEEISKEELGKKIWRFESNKNFILHVLSDSLNITSTHHKTYNLDNSGDKFRDIIELVVNNFLEITQIPIITRIGLRYIDVCPLPSKDNETLEAYYNSAFPLCRFNLSDASEMGFKTVIKKNGYSLIYIESLRLIEDEYKIILDFDAFAEKISPENYLNATDKLHSIISTELSKRLKNLFMNICVKHRRFVGWNWI